MAAPRRNLDDCDDAALARLLARRDPHAVRLLTRRNNQRLFRVAWSILQNRADAEDAVQSACFSALRSIATFEGRSSLSTWLTRIVTTRRSADGARTSGERPSSTTNP